MRQYAGDRTLQETWIFYTEGNTLRSSAEIRTELLETTLAASSWTDGALLPTRDVASNVSTIRFSRRVSVQVKVDFDGDLEAHWTTVFHRWFEAPGFHRGDCFFIQPHTQATEHADIRGMAVCVDNYA
jgi:hypothetical protein